MPDAHLRWLFVAAPHWGTGLALELYGLAIAAMRSRGVRSARLFTPAGQVRARCLYEREGWRLRLRLRLDPYLDEGLGLELVEYGLAPT